MQALIVSEDPKFISRVQTAMRGRDCKVVGCLGPVNTPCPPQSGRRCSLAEQADVIIVDAPSGTFSHLSRHAPAGPYSSALRETCSHSLVVLEAPNFIAGPTGGVARVPSRTEAVALLKALTQPSPGANK